jgi:hypothetical protein
MRSQNRGARPNELFLKMTAVEERSKWNRSLLCLSGLPGTNAGRILTHGQETGFSH